MTIRTPATPFFLIAFLLFVFMLGYLFGWGVTGPILSEMNPNGTIDYWYLFDGARR